MLQGTPKTGLCALAWTVAPAAGGLVGTPQQRSSRARARWKQVRLGRAEEEGLCASTACSSQLPCWGPGTPLPPACLCDASFVQYTLHNSRGRNNPFFLGGYTCHFILEKIQTMNQICSAGQCRVAQAKACFLGVAPLNFWKLCRC